MRSLSFVLALAFLIGGPLLQRAPQPGLPGAGVFTYTGTPPVFDQPPGVAVVASR